jgi:hypothetical protein
VRWNVIDIDCVVHFQFLALCRIRLLEKLGLDGIFTISCWDKHQSAKSVSDSRESNGFVTPSFTLSLAVLASNPFNMAPSEADATAEDRVFNGVSIPSVVVIKGVVSC